MIPDITYPSLFDPKEIGESALDNALAWDQIAPARFNRYHDYSGIMPMLTTLHEKRAANDPDYLYLQDRVAIAQEARTITALPLQEADRLAMRDGQESKALVIENKRRVSKGLEPLKTLADAEQNEQSSGSDAQSKSTTPPPKMPDDPIADNSDEGDEDVLLMETGRILVDAITLRPNTSVAGRAE